jgi:hypothetical protein
VNRKAVLGKLNNIISGCILEPDLVDRVNNQPIEEGYIENVNAIQRKIAFIKNNFEENHSDYASVKQLGKISFFFNNI